MISSPFPLFRKNTYACLQLDEANQFESAGISSSGGKTEKPHSIGSRPEKAALMAFRRKSWLCATHSQPGGSRKAVCDVATAS